MNKHNPGYFDTALRNANRLADGGDGVFLSPEELRGIALAFRDLVEVRGLPTPLICHPSIQLVSGDYFDFSDPENSPMRITDIAHSLSKNSRYNGHTLGPKVYSIAQHSVLASRNAEEPYKFSALMHDAHEFVYGDMTSPLKQLCPDYKALEKRGEHAMALRYRLPTPMHREVKIVDIRMAATEKRDVMPNMPDDHWQITEGYDPFPEKIEVWDYHQSFENFMDAFFTLQPDHNLRMDAGILANILKEP